VFKARFGLAGTGFIINFTEAFVEAILTVLLEHSRFFDFVTGSCQSAKF
jgi:hypothetical protein